MSETSPATMSVDVVDRVAWIPRDLQMTVKHPKGQSYCLGRQQLKWNQGNQEAHLVEDSQNKLREPPGAVKRCSRSSYKDDDGKMQEEKSTAASELEFQIVNNFQVGFEFGHVMCWL
jgi:hypothetical protein